MEEATYREAVRLNQDTSQAAVGDTVFSVPGNRYMVVSRVYPSSLRLRLPLGAPPAASQASWERTEWTESRSGCQWLHQSELTRAVSARLPVDKHTLQQLVKLPLGEE